jgi:hypothetical protein
MRTEFASLIVVTDLLAQAGAGIGPDMIGLARRDVTDASRLGVIEAGEEAELDQRRGLGIGRRQPVQAASSCAASEVSVDAAPAG